jgi:16S rRNA (guanine1516-N2)-methyltransferase
VTWPDGAVVVAGDAAHRPAAVDLARALGAVVRDPADWRAAPGPPVVVWVDGEGAGLRGPPRGAAPRRPPPPPRGRRSGREPLLRALGGAAATTTVIDATAGWGADAGVLAAAGARVTMIERSPVVVALLTAALERWRATGHDAARRLTLVHGDARAVLASGVVSADVVYLDPFYAGRDHATTTGADLRWLRVAARWGDDGEGGERRAGAPDEDGGGSGGDAPSVDAELLRAARGAAGRRVVVKRPIGATPLAGVAPSGSLRGRTTRFDLYAPEPWRRAHEGAGDAEDRRP